MTSALPVAVTKMSARVTASSIVTTSIALHRRLQRADRIDFGDEHARAAVAERAAEPLPTSPKPATVATLPASITSVPRRIASTSDSLQPYRLSNLDLVTLSLTLIAGNGSLPFLASSYSRWTPVVVSSRRP
jgi:hypothetical protein